MNYQSHQLWTKLARHHGKKLVSSNLDCSKHNIINLCEILGLSIEQFKTWAGLDRLVREYRNLDHFQERNPNLKLLEMIYEKQINQGIFDQ